MNVLMNVCALMIILIDSFVQCLNVLLFSLDDKDHELCLFCYHGGPERKYVRLKVLKRDKWNKYTEATKFLDLFS